MLKKRRTETWRKIPDWPYSVSDGQRVRREPGIDSQGRWWAGGIIAGTVRKDGRRYFKLRNGKGLCWRPMLAQLMLVAFVEPRPSQKHEARHLNDDPTDDRLSNLAWGTRRQNIQDAQRNGKFLRGEDHPHAKFTDNQIKEIRARCVPFVRSGPNSAKALAKEYGTNVQFIQGVVAGRKRAHGKEYRDPVTA